jgi:hypothetical protein
LFVFNVFSSCYRYLAADVFVGFACVFTVGIDTLSQFQAVGPRKHIRVVLQGRRVAAADNQVRLHVV